MESSTHACIYVFCHAVCIHACTGFDYMNVVKQTYAHARVHDCKWTCAHIGMCTRSEGRYASMCVRIQRKALYCYQLAIFPRCYEWSSPHLSEVLRTSLPWATTQQVALPLPLLISRWLWQQVSDRQWHRMLANVEPNSKVKLLVTSHT